MGGEKGVTDVVHLPMMGSPPRGRGKAEQQATMDTVDRITPAWAGKRDKMLDKRRMTRDHPRVGGEKRGKAGGVVYVTGSPPRGRGKGY